MGYEWAAEIEISISNSNISTIHIGGYPQIIQVIRPFEY